MVAGNLRISPIILLTILGMSLGCLKPKVSPGPSPAALVKSKILQRVGALPKASPAPPPHKSAMPWVTIAWSNMPPLWNGVTGLEGSTDLLNWYTVWSAEAQVGEIVVTLSNRPPLEFYRAYNSL